MTDAISAWFIRNDGKSSVDFINLLKAKDSSGLMELINVERENGILKNDDIAIIYLEVK